MVDGAGFATAGVWPFCGGGEPGTVPAIPIPTAPTTHAATRSFECKGVAIPLVLRARAMAAADGGPAIVVTRARDNRLDASAAEVAATASKTTPSSTPR